MPNSSQLPDQDDSDLNRVLGDSVRLLAISQIDERLKIAMCARGGQVPEWFDFPFDKTLLVFIDSGDYTDKHPAHSHEWYVDEDRGVVYFLMIEG